MAFARRKQTGGRDLQVAAPGIGFLASGSLHGEQCVTIQREVERAARRDDVARRHVRAAHQRLLHGTRFQCVGAQGNRPLLGQFLAETDRVGVGHVAGGNALPLH